MLLYQHPVYLDVYLRDLGLIYCFIFLTQVSARIQWVVIASLWCQGSRLLAPLLIFSVNRAVRLITDAKNISATFADGSKCQSRYRHANGVDLSLVSPDRKCDV